MGENQNIGPRLLQPGRLRYKRSLVAHASRVHVRAGRPHHKS